MAIGERPPCVGLRNGALVDPQRKLKFFRLTFEPAIASLGRRGFAVQSGSNSGSNPEAGNLTKGRQVFSLSIQCKSRILRSRAFLSL